jgi:signal transduction histidine kinase/ActR/RegA family two-component response regulator
MVRAYITRNNIDAVMKEESKTKEELLEEIARLSRELSEYRAVEKEHKVLADSSRANEESLRRHNRVLIELARSKKLDCDDLNSALREILEASASTLEVERTSVWLYNENRSKIYCVDLYQKSVGCHSSSYELSAANYPSYFQALEEERTIAAHDAQNDPRTREFTESYLNPLGISSMLDAPIRLHGQMAGVVCHEQVGPARHWTPDEQNFAGSIADLVVLAIEAYERNQLEKQSRELYQQAQEARNEAELANRIKDEFLAIVTHELKTPLTAMLGWARMLRTTNLDSAVAARAVETIERNARTQAQLIDDLLDTSRIISGKLHLDLQQVELIPIIQTAIDTVRSEAEAKRIQLDLSLDPWTGPVSGDPTRLQQIVWNLLSNAIKFTPEQGRVGLLLERVGSEVQFTVCDTGAGINPDFLPYVFDRFRQAIGSVTRRQAGLGLGLAIVRHLVERHGGKITAESPGEGKGATFKVILPLEKSKAAYLKSNDGKSSIANLQAEHPAILKNLRILVVEDEPDTRYLLTSMLQKFGASVKDVGSVREALKEMEKSLPDVIVSDIGMPDEDGYSLIQKVRAMKPEKGGRIPAIALTAYTRAEERVKVLSAGFDVHLPKPVEPDELVTTIAKLVG